MGLFAGRDTVLEGWILKKKRKKMQGYAKRYFWLDKKGILSYSMSPKHPVRDSLFVGLASIGRSKKQRTFHIDSGRTVMHIKTLSDNDFDQWSNAFRKFIQVEDDKLNARTAGGRQNSAGKFNQDDSPIDITLAYQATAKMNKPLQDLWEVYEELKGESNASSPSHERSDPHDHKSPKEKISKIFKLGHDKKDASSTSSASTHKGSGSADASLTKVFQTALESLQAQHQSLLNALNANTGDSSPDTNAGQMAATYASRNAIGFSSGGGGATSYLSRTSLRSEDTAGNYQDAEGGAVYDLDDEDFESEAYNSGVEEGDEDEDEEEEEAGQKGGKGKDADKESQASDDSDATAKDTVKRREQLPAPVSGDEFSMFSVLKKNMGKDLSKISFPVSFNEPLSGLQRLCEEVEYTNLLRRAARTDDSIEKLCFVTAFAISSYASTKYRSSRKPFNPLLGETFECFRADKDLKFVSEKVIHNPPTLACWAEGKDWEYTAHSGATQKFWGKSLEIIPQGKTRLKFKNSDDVFTWSKPSSFIRNIMSGQKYLEHVGELKVKNETTGESAVVSFKEGSMWGGEGTRNKLEAKVYDKSGSVSCELTGKWDESVSRKLDKENFQTIFKVNDYPKDAPKYYGFGQFSIQLNEITDDIKDRLAPTDSRLRPDQRAFEEGKVDEAEKKKAELEDKQRQKRKQYESDGKQPEPKWFEEKDGRWEYKGGYAEAREKKEWDDPDIY